MKLIYLNWCFYSVCFAVLFGGIVLHTELNNIGLLPLYY